MELINLSNFTVRCPVCGESLKQIDRQHTLEHGMTQTEFKAEYGYTTLLQRSRKKIKELYRPDFTRWGTTYVTADGEARYVTKKYYGTASIDPNVKSATKFPMSDSDFHRHFSGSNVLAVFPRDERSSVFVTFDVDTKENAPDHVRLLVQTLLDEGIPMKDIHVSFSGSKGFHIDLFTLRPVAIERWIELGEYVVMRAGLTGENIEFRPTKKNGNALKLPLTLHQKTGNFAAFVDPLTLERKGIQASHDYLFSIEPMDRTNISTLLIKARRHAEEVKRLMASAKAEKAQKAKEKPERKKTDQSVKVNDEHVYQTIEQKRESVVLAMTKGLFGQGTRWNTTRSIALYLFHESGWDIESIRNFLTEWTEAQFKENKISTPLQRCLEEIDDLLEWVPKTPGFFVTERELKVSAADVAWVMSVQEQSARDLLWALLLRSKAYANVEGRFFTGQRSLQSMFKVRPLSSRTIAKWQHWLVEHGFIEATTPTEEERKARKATTYRLLFVPPAVSEVVGEVDFDTDMDCRDLLRTIAAKMEQLTTTPHTVDAVEGFF